MGIKSFDGEHLNRADEPRAGEPVRVKGLSVFRLRVIAAIFLFLQPASTSIVPLFVGSDMKNMTALTMVVLCEVISWCAIPIYAWLTAEAYRNTRNKVRYSLRVLLLAIVCEVPYDIVTFGKPWDLSSQNPVFAVFLAIVVLALIDYARTRTGAAVWLLVVVFVCAGALWALLLRVGARQGIMNIGVLLIGFALIFFFMVKYENSMMMTAGLFGAVSLIAPAIGVAFLHYRNDRLGYKKTWTPWAFYGVYPAMLLVCATLAV